MWGLQFWYSPVLLEVGLCRRSEGRGGFALVAGDVPLPRNAPGLDGSIPVPVIVADDFWPVPALCGINVKAAVESMCNGEGNIFISGSAGYGKTFFVRRHLYPALKARFKQGVSVTASTRAAASLYRKEKGMTLNKFAGVFLAHGSPDQLVRHMKEEAKKRIERVQVLIVDEISMISAGLLDKLDAVFRAVRGSAEMFGGVRVIAVGDFCQLGPLGDFTEGPDGELKRESFGYAFEAKAWVNGGFVPFRLKIPHRYEYQGQHWKVLEACRSMKSLKGRLFKKVLERVADKPPAIGPNVFYLVNKISEASEHCESKLRELEGEAKPYLAVDWLVTGPRHQCIQHQLTETPAVKQRRYKDEDGYHHNLLSACKGVEVVNLKKGALVMAVGPIKQGVPAGTIGKVTGFSTLDRAAFGAMDRNDLDRKVYELLGIGENEAEKAYNFSWPWGVVLSSIPSDTSSPSALSDSPISLSYCC
jgi:hypothetical protein